MMEDRMDRNRYLWQLLFAIAFLAALPFVGRCLMGCTPAQMQPVRDAAEQAQEAALVARSASDVARLAADAMELSAELANVAADCERQMEAAPPPDPLGVHPCAWDVLAATKRAVNAIQELAEALEAVAAK